MCGEGAGSRLTIVIVYSCLREFTVRSSMTTIPPPSTVSIVLAKRLGVSASKSCVMWKTKALQSQIYGAHQLYINQFTILVFCIVTPHLRSYIYIYSFGRCLCPKLRTNEVLSSAYELRAIQIKSDFHISDFLRFHRLKKCLNRTRVYCVWSELIYS